MIKPALVTWQPARHFSASPITCRTPTTNATLRHNINNKQGRDTHFKIGSWSILLWRHYEARNITWFQIFTHLQSQTTFVLTDVNTYSLVGWNLPLFLFRPLLCSGGDISTTSGDGGGISNTSWDDNTMTSSSLQKKYQLTQYTLCYSSKLKSD